MSIICNHCKKPLYTGGWTAYNEHGVFHYHNTCFSEMHEDELKEIGAETP